MFHPSLTIPSGQASANAAGGHSPAASMPDVALMTQPRLRAFEIYLPLLVVALDQLTKAIVRAQLPLHKSVAIIPGILDFTHIRNTGAAFGILNAVDFPFKTGVIAVVATVALVGVALYARSL